MIRLAPLLALSLAVGCSTDPTARGALEIAGEPSDRAVEQTVARTASGQVAERAVQELELHTDPDFMQVPQAERADWRGVTLSEAVDVLRERATIERRDDLATIDVAVEHPDPEVAATACNALLEATVDLERQVMFAPLLLREAELSAQLDALERQGSNELDLAERRRRRAAIDAAEAERTRVRTRRRSMPAPLRVLDRCRVPR